MATFKEKFAEERKKQGKGKTFTFEGKSYTTDYAGEKAPKSRPANLNPQSGAAQSGTAGKVAPKSTTKNGIQNFDKNKADVEARRKKSQEAGRPKASTPSTSPARPTPDAMLAKSNAAKNVSDAAAQKIRSENSRADLELMTGRKGAAAQYKVGGVVKMKEGSAKDMREDKAMAKKSGMTMKQHEASAADKKHDAGKKMMSGGVVKKATGGSMRGTGAAIRGKGFSGCY